MRQLPSRVWGAVVGWKTHLRVSIANRLVLNAPGSTSHSIYCRTRANPLRSEVTLIVGRGVANSERIDDVAWSRSISLYGTLARNFSVSPRDRGLQAEVLPEGMREAIRLLAHK